MRALRLRSRLALLSASLGALALLGSASPSAPRESVRPNRAITTADGSLDPADGLSRDVAAIRRQIQTREAGTYIPEMLVGRDSALARWADRGGMPIRVWVGDAVRIPSWTPAHANEARAAFEEWNDVGLPLRFAFVADSADAEVHVLWTDRFAEPISGRTRWARDDDWWITDGVITLAVHHHQGMLLDPDAVRAMALHEIGHLIGLDHTANLGSVMARRVRVRGIAPIDRSTADLLYSVPAGKIR